MSQTVPAMPTVPIGTAAQQLGLAAHVLRHWDDVGVLRPRRSPAGHRYYDTELLTRARLVRLGQRAGLSLGDIKELGQADRDRRVALVEARRQALLRQIENLRRAEQFLAHTLECRHPLVSQCPDCSQFATATSPQ